MTRASSIQSSQELRIYNSRGCSSQHTCVMGKGKNRVQLVNASLSSHGLQQDAWTVHFLSSTCRPIIATPSRCNVFVCRSLLTPSGGNTIPVLKFASVILTRSYDVLCRSQVVLELIPAIGIIAFATWGLGPLMHLGRIIFFYVFHSYFSTFLCFIRWLNYSVSDSLYHSPIPHFLPFFFHFFGCNLQQKSDNNWSKSRTNYVMTSYLQPLLLWTGMTLICRALNPVILHSEVSQAVKQRLLNFVQSLSTVLAFAYCLSRLIQQAQKFLSETRDSDNATHMGFSFAGKAVYSAVWIAAVSLCMELLGFSTQRWLTAGGLGTVLLTLAGREVFTNFLSSVMIHATRPFVVNEWIQTKIEGYEVSGTVEHVGWWSPTIIRGDDREAVHIPNHKFTVNVVRNLSQKTHWRVKTHLAISHLDVNKIINIVADMRKVLAKNPQIEQQRLHRRVFLDNIDPENQALKILVSCFVKTSHFEEYLRVKEAILLDLLRVISHHRARLATHIRTVQKIYNETDLDNVPFSNTIFTHSGVAANCPLLLIEPSHKINADDKTKASTRSVRTNEEKDAKGEAASTSESKAEPNVDSIKDKVTTTTSDSSTTSNVSAIPKSNPQLGKSLHDNSVQNSSETLQPSGSTGHVCKKKMGLNTEEITPGGTTLEEYSVNESKRSDIPTATSQAKQDVERTVSSPSVGRPPLEENIVLGVALEGSKRTLLIEEEIDPSSFPQKSKELAGSRDGNGSPAGKDKKDGQMPTVQSTSQID